MYISFSSMNSCCKLVYWYVPTLFLVIIPSPETSCVDSGSIRRGFLDIVLFRISCTLNFSGVQRWTSVTDTSFHDCKLLFILLGSTSVKLDVIGLWNKVRPEIPLSSTTI